MSDDLFAGTEDDPGDGTAAQSDSAAPRRDDARSRRAQAAGDPAAGPDDGASVVIRSFGEVDEAAIARAKGANVIGSRAPLAERLRPESLDDVIGQEDLIGPGRPLRALLDSGQVPSMIFWGPPGCGKTTLSSLITRLTKSDSCVLSAVTATLRDVREVLEQAKRNRHYARRTILFVDEIHRFNKAQQDAFLPVVEAGTITLIGATTENPSFSVIGPLLSRCRVFTLKPLDAEALRRILRRALTDTRRGLGPLELSAEDATLDAIVQHCDGDARRALTLLELSANATRAENRAIIEVPTVRGLAQHRSLHYDKSGEEHFNLMSALHKSLRSSDVQAAIYWFERMIVSGEDPLYIGRRMVRFASEDIGLADPQALSHALAAVDAYRMLGTPEGELALLQAAIYLATAPKSNKVYATDKAARAEIEATGSLPVPLAIRNAPTGLMKQLGYGSGYQYDPDMPDHVGGNVCLPQELLGRQFYEPGALGFEREIRKRMDYWEARRSGNPPEAAPPAEPAPPPSTGKPPE